MKRNEKVKGARQLTNELYQHKIEIERWYQNVFETLTGHLTRTFDKDDNYIGPIIEIDGNDCDVDRKVATGLDLYWKLRSMEFGTVDWWDEFYSLAKLMNELRRRDKEDI